MREQNRAATSVWASVALALSVFLGGCGLGGSDVELNGGIFDALGVSSSSSSSQRSSEPRLAPRAGLVLPPSDNRLPPPGEPAEAARIASEAWPDDPDQRKIRNAGQIDRQQEEFCRKQALEAKTTTGMILPNGPKGPCNSSVLGIFGVSGAPN